MKRKRMQYWNSTIVMTLFFATVEGTAYSQMNSNQVDRAGSCIHTQFQYNAQGQLDYPYPMKVLRQGAPTYENATSSKQTGTLSFSQSLYVAGVEQDRVQVKETGTQKILGWVERADLLCGLSPLKGPSGLEQKFYIRTATEMRDDQPTTVSAYPVSSVDDCHGDCRELSRFAGYFVFDIDLKSNSYLLAEMYRIDEGTRLVGWLSGQYGFIWDTALGLRPKEDLKFPTDHPTMPNEERAVCAYRDVKDAINDPEGRCLPILGGDRWYLSPERIPILGKIKEHNKEFYKVVLPMPGQGATSYDNGTIKLKGSQKIDPVQFVDGQKYQGLENMKNVDIFFLIDGTKSLRSHFEKIRGEYAQQGIVQQIIETLQKEDMFRETLFRFGFRVYRDKFAGNKELGEGMALSPDCKMTDENQQKNLEDFQKEIEKVKELDQLSSQESTDDYPENLFGGIVQAIDDLSSCPNNTKLLFVIGDGGYDTDSQRQKGRTPIEIMTIASNLRQGKKPIVPFFIQTPNEKNLAGDPQKYERAYNLFTSQAKEVLGQILSNQSDPMDYYLLESTAEDLNQKILQGVKGFGSSQVINELILDLRGGAALTDAIERLRGDEKYKNIFGLFWELIEQGSCQELGEQCENRVYDTIIDGYIPVSEDVVEDVWLKSDDLDKFAGLLRAFDRDKLAGVSGTELRATFTHTMISSLENVIRKPKYEEVGGPISEYLKRKGGLPVSEMSPLFHYSIDNLNDPEAVPDCELMRLLAWVNSSTQMLNIMYQGNIRPFYKTGENGDCPSGQDIPYIEGDIQSVPLGKNLDMRYDRAFQKARVYWVPSEFLP